jgi:hypothetical protein
MELKRIFLAQLEREATATRSVYRKAALIGNLTRSR